MIDFDLDTQALTILAAPGVIAQCPTIHQVIATQNATGADAMDISRSVSLKSGSPADRGSLYLMPSSVQSDAHVFEAVASIDRDTLLDLIGEMIQHIVDRYDVWCVIIDCGRTGSPYTAAAVHLATAALIIGQNEPITYESIEPAKDRIRQMYPTFNATNVKTVINKVRGWESLKERQQHIDIFFAIPFTIDVTNKSEGVENIRQSDMLVFENCIVDFVRKVFVGHPEFIPQPHVLLPREDLDLLKKLDRIAEAPKVKRLSMLRHLWPIGWWAERERKSILQTAAAIAAGGAEGLFEQIEMSTGDTVTVRRFAAPRAGGLFEQIKTGATKRADLAKIRKLARTIPDLEEGESISGPAYVCDVCATARGGFDDAAETECDEADCTVFAPPEAEIGDSVLVQVFAHISEQAEAVRQMAQEFDADARQRGVTALGTEIARGSKLIFELLMPELTVEDPVQELTWRGRPDSVQFEVGVPDEARPQTVIGKVLISQNTVPIGEVKFKLKVVSQGTAADKTPAPAGEAHRYTLAFISYASQDRPEVLRRVQMLNAVGIKYFQDLLDLDPGDRWAQKLFRYIDDSDVMFLFWSSAAKRSEWVEREWQYGLEHKDDDFIRPVIIEGPPPVPPPPELAHLHFNDKVLYFLQEK